ncbi:hypothetical protein F511_16820 [Dorcoceras hygrometricum]|uniref:Uncharacterized protein n=1 Tax=Dorcoceras hygrometricum TaxID=472368 RepID=A0A2Z7CW32_9LAMI|nr:hypothetical protein F511_16820 [Dorcoceras hygrometricum]
MGRFKPIIGLYVDMTKGFNHNITSHNPSSHIGAAPLPLSADHRAPPTRRRAPPSAASCRDRTCSDQLFEEFPSVPNSSGLLVRADEGIVFPVVDLIRRSTTAYLLKCRFPCETGRSQAPRRQQGCRPPPCAAATNTARDGASTTACRPAQLLRNGRPASTGVAHGDVQAAPCMARPCRARRGSARPCVARHVMAAAVAVRPPSGVFRQPIVTCFVF